jgi:hypothetical protein
MQPNQPRIEIDGVSVPAQEALDTIREGIATSTDTAQYLMSGMAQPVGDALQQSKQACDAIQRRLRKFSRAVVNQANQLTLPTIDALSGGVGTMLAQSQSLADSLARGAAFGGMPLPVVGAVAGTPPDAVLPPVTPYTGGAPAISLPSPVRSGIPGIPGAATNCVYVDCQAITKQFDAQGNPLGGVVWSYIICQACAGPTIAMKPAPSILSATWDLVPGINCPPGIWNATAAQWQQIVTFAYQKCGASFPPPTPPTPPLWNIYYYCNPCTDSSSPHPWIAGVFSANPGGKYLLYTGAGTNFTSQPAAQAALDSAGAGLDAACFLSPEEVQAACGGGPTPPSGPQPQPQQGGQCPATPVICESTTQSIDLPCADTKLPDILNIGSPEFCAAIPVLRANLADVGRKIVSLVQGIDISSPIGVPVAAQAAPQLNWTTDLANILTFLSQKSDSNEAKGIMGSLRKVANCWWAIINGATWCNLAEVGFLAIAKAFFEILQRFRTGWDAGIWATADISVHIPPVIKVLDYLIAEACPDEIPSPSEAIGCYLKNTATEEQVKCWLACKGWRWEIIDCVIQSQRERVSPDKLINISRRLALDDDTISGLLRYYGFTSKTDSDNYIFAYDQVPTLGQVLHFLQRNVFDAEYVADFGLMDGFSERFWPRYGAGLRAIGVQEQTARDEYAAHWINPSISQLAQMVFRLRPDKPEVKDTFTEADFLRVLAEQDVAPYFRQRLLDVSYNAISIRYLQQLAQRGLLSLEDLKSRWRDLGYRSAEADLLAQMSWWSGNRQKAIQEKGYTPAVVAKLWPAGQIDRPTAYRVLADQGMSPANVDTLLEVADKSLAASLYEAHSKKSLTDYASLAIKAYSDGVISASDATDALKAAGYTDTAAALEIRTALLRVQMADIDRVTKAIHRSFMRGEVDAGQAEAALAVAGVLEPRAGALVRMWILELSTPRKSLETSRIIKYAETGIISVPVAEVRLRNLGWLPGDIPLLVAEIEQAIAKARSLAATRRESALAKAEAAAKRASAAIVKQYCKMYSLSKLKLWYSIREVDEAYVSAKLSKCGYDAEFITAFLEELSVARAAKDKKAEKSGPAGVEYTGPGAVT